MPNYSNETPRQALNAEIRRFRTQTQVLKAIVSTAQSVEQGYVISPELFEEVKKAILP